LAIQSPFSGFWIRASGFRSGRELSSGELPPTACRRPVSGTLSLPSLGCFSPFPHGTGSLSVGYEYLGLEGGPPTFRQGFTCPALLKDDPGFTCTGLSPTMAAFSKAFQLTSDHHWPGPRSLVTTSGVSVDVLSSGYMRYFSSPGSLLNPLQIQMTQKSEDGNLKSETRTAFRADAF
jgi:hypothetical protein